ncbi:DNA polymerase subunit Cdc27 [Mrakia frigida]|uniref:DNA polymerase subunit Cdc27 n=1 Tax=Mrakia frigida TaxID=29902 RepID=UPI003FCC0ADA
MDETQDFLQRWIGQDLKTMTFRLLSRERGINVNEAKTQLANFHSSNPSSCHPTWILTGTLLPPPSDAMDVDEQDASQGAGEDEGGKATTRMGVVLCTEEDVEEKKALFIQATLSQHVYSLAPGILRDPSTLIAPSNLLRSHPKYYRPAIYGTSVSPSIASTSSTSAVASTSSSKKVAAVVPEVKGKGKEKEKEAAPTAPDKLKPAKKMVAGTLDFSKNLSKEQKEEKKTTLKRKSSPTGGSSKSTTVNVSKPAPPPPPPSPPVAKSSFKAKPKSRVVLSEDEDEEEIVFKPKKKQMNQAEIDAELKGLEEMMWDDMDVDENGEDKVVEEKGKGKGKAVAASTYSSDIEEEAQPVVGKPKKKLVPNFKPNFKTKKVAIDSEDEKDDEDEDASGTSSSKAKKPAAAAAKEKKAKKEEKRDEQGRLRKVRRVVKTVKGKNARGYEVEQDVSEQESYYTSDEEAPAPAPTKSKPKPKPKPSTSTSSTATTTANDEKKEKEKEKKPLAKPKPAPVAKKPPTGQTSIGSFFSKK